MFNFKYIPKPTYTPSVLFKPFFAMPLGIKIWEFLTIEIVVFRMVCFSDARRPAVEGIDEEFKKQFGVAYNKLSQNVKDKIKQMTGHMIRQILEAHDLKLDVQGVKIRNNEIFTVGSRYKR